MKLRKRVSNPVWSIAVVIGCLMLSQVAMAESYQMVEAGKALLKQCEAQNIEIPDALKAVLGRLESLNESRSDNSRIFIQQIPDASMAFVSETVTMEWNGSAWVNVYKEILTMNDAMTEMQGIVFQIWDGSAWVNDSRISMTTNAQGNITSMAMDIWQNGAWVTQMLTTYTYDGSGNLIEDILQMDSNYDGVLEDYFKSIYSYTGGLLTKLEDYMWYGSWTKCGETTYTYNGQGKLVEEVFSMGTYGYFFYNGKILYAYNGSGDVETKISQDYSVASSTWTNSYKTIYTYNGQRQTTSELSQTWDGSAWVNADLHTSTYGGPSGELNVELWQTWNGLVWVDVDRTTSEYDGDGNEISYLYEIWNGASWENVERGTTEYNTSDFPTVTVVQIWEGGAWVNETRYEYTYSGGTAVDDSPMTQPEAFSMTNYPNPFNPSTTIQFALPVNDQVSITIYDATGRMVKTLIQNESVYAGVHEVHWNGTNIFSQPVASGVYFYSIQGLQFNQTHRCLLLK